MQTREPGGDEAGSPVAVRDESAGTDGCDQAHPSPPRDPLGPTFQNTVETGGKKTGASLSGVAGFVYFDHNCSSGLEGEEQLRHSREVGKKDLANKQLKTRLIDIKRTLRPYTSRMDEGGEKRGPGP